MSEITAIIGLRLGSPWRQDDRRIAQVLLDIEQQGPEGVIQYGLWGRVSGHSFELAPPQSRFGNRWIPRLRGTVHSSPTGSTVTASLRFIQPDQVFLLLFAMVASIGAMAFGLGLLIGGTGSGSLAVLFGVALLAGFAYIARTMARVAKVMADALSRTLDEVI